MTTKALREKIFALPVAEKLSLVHELWENIAANEHAIPLTDDDKRILEERLAAHERDPGAVVSWADAKAEANRQIRQMRKQ